MLVPGRNLDHMTEIFRIRDIARDMKAEESRQHNRCSDLPPKDFWFSFQNIQVVFVCSAHTFPSKLNPSGIALFLAGTRPARYDRRKRHTLDRTKFFVTLANTDAQNTTPVSVIRSALCFKQKLALKFWDWGTSFAVSYYQAI